HPEPLLEEIHNTVQDLTDRREKMRRLSQILEEGKITQNTFNIMKSRNDHATTKIMRRLLDIQPRLTAELDSVCRTEQELVKTLDLLEAEKVMEEISQADYTTKTAKAHEELDSARNKKSALERVTNILSELLKE
ncbi:MAG: hypothetical protein NTX81_01315, partial [Candidatus Bathyarchaeota archaeon]|nr:hypothetical protein [Candidatus Bathyarchaeota archaeon]